MKKLAFLCLCASLSVLNAQPDETRNWVFGIHGGFNQYRGELGNGWYARDQAAYSFAGISLSRFLNRNLDLTFFGSKGELGYQTEWRPGLPENFNYDFLLSKTTTHLWIRYYPLGHEVFFQPFVFGGGSLLWQRARGNNFYIGQKRFDFGFPEAGLGFNLRITPWMRFQVQEIFTYTSADYVDYNDGGLNDLYLMHAVGLVFNFPRFSGLDEPDHPEREVDKCPKLPKEMQARRAAKKAARTKAKMTRKAGRN